MTVVCDVSEQVQLYLSKTGLVPWGIQQTAIESGLLKGNSLMVCSPTGSGKTLVGELALLRAAITGTKGLYLVPLRALAHQVFTLLKERYSSFGLNIGISTGDYQDDGAELSEHDMIVTTYERADSLLRRKSHWLEAIGAVVVDEIQNLSAPERGARLESVLIRLRRNSENLQIIALSATVGDPDEVAHWLNCELIESNQRPVPLINKVVNSDDKTATLSELVMTTVQANGQAIVFSRTRREAESYALKLAQDVGRQLTTFEKNELDSELESVENWNAHISPNLRVLLHDGVAYHHAGLGYRVRDLIERLFKKGLVRVASATTTLASGMDLPARIVVLTSPRSPQDYRNLLPANRVHQMLGRAGRPGCDKLGFGIILTSSKGEADEVRRSYFDMTKDAIKGKEQFTAKYDTITSLMGSSRALTEQLLVFLDDIGETTPSEVEAILLSESYFAQSIKLGSKSPMRALNLGEITAESAIELHANVDTIRSARQGVLGLVKIRERNETVIGGLVSSNEGSIYTCRFSTRLSSTGTAEGPMCSCGTPLDSNRVLCQHLVALGMEAAKNLGSLADYVIPLSLDVSSPLGVLKSLDLVEGGNEGGIRPTKLGSIANRLYLKITTVREMLALLPMVEDSTYLLWLLKHLVSLETGVTLDDSFEHLVAALVSTDIDLGELANNYGFHEGDVIGLLETSRWLLFAIGVISDVGGLTIALELSQGLLSTLELKLSIRERKRVGD
ncbi:MAG: DEAD/DEAH box helicase [Candidatus Thorarchaeota archaeon]